MKSFIAIILGLVPCLFSSCASYKEAVQSLEKIHREPVAVAPSAAPDMVHSFLEYASAVDEDGEWVKIEDPVDYCLTQIQTITDYDFQEEMDKSAAACILCMTANRSPSQLVRASAVRSLIVMLGPDAAKFTLSQVKADPKELEERLGKLKLLFDIGRTQGGREEAAQQDYLATIMFFGRIRMDRAEVAWKLLKAVILDLGRHERDHAALSAFRSAAERMNRQAFFRTLLEAMADPSDVVRSMAVGALFLFPMDVIRPVLSSALEQNLYMQAPVHRIEILKGLKEKAAGPRIMGFSLLDHTVNSLRSGHAGVVQHALNLLREVTGIQEDNPGFWIDWWRTYRIKHADDMDG